MTLSRPDFDFSKYVEVPDQWIENALNIPNTVQEKPKIIPIRHYVTAASIVLVVTLGISVYFLFGNKSPIPVAQNPTAAATEAQPIDATDATFPTEQNTVQSTDSTVNNQVATSSQAIPTTPATQVTTDTRGNVIPSPTQTNDHPTVAPAPSATTAPSTEPPQDTPTNALRPSPTQKPVAHPTTAPAPTTAVPPVEQPTEDDPPYELPTEDWYDPPTETPWEIVLTATIPDAILRQGSPIYCRIHLSNGMPVGEWELYSDLHRAAVYGSTAVYEPLASGLNLSHGKYNYYFYDSTGKTFAKGTFYIN